MKNVVSHLGFILIAFVLCNCAGQAQSAAQQPVEVAVSLPTPTPAPTVIVPTGTLPGAAKADDPCPVTTPVTVPASEIPQSTLWDPISTSPWYKSPDGKLWAAADVLHVGGNKYAWFRPAGAPIRASGHRLDRRAPPMDASIPCCYEGALQIGGLTFPTGGCWEIVAESEGSVLRYVVKVSGSDDSAVQQQHCPDLEEAVKASDEIIVATVKESGPASSGAVWQSVGVVHKLTNPICCGLDETVVKYEILQREEPRLKLGHTYLLFLQGDPLQIVCPQQTLAEVNGKQVVLLDQGGQPLWSGDTVEAIEKQVSNIVRSR